MESKHLAYMMMLQVCLIYFLLESASAMGAPVELDLKSTTVSTLQAHSGQRVILSGYFVQEFEVSALFPRVLKPRDYEIDRAVWVSLAANEPHNFLGLPFRGMLKVEGRLEAEKDRQYGHLGGYPAELIDAKITGISPRQVVVGIIIFAAASFSTLIVRWGLKRRKRKMQQAP
jgi:hypothetical protein